MLHVRLSKLSVDALLALLRDIEELEPAYDRLADALQQNAISGRVLMHCDLSELKALLGLSFGHWEIFRLLINCLRDVEKLQPTMKLTEIDAVQPSFQRKKSVIEKQVSQCRNWFIVSIAHIVADSFAVQITIFTHTKPIFHSNSGNAAESS